MTAQQVLDQIQEHEVEFVDFRFADMLGKHHHVTFPAHARRSSAYMDQNHAIRLAGSPGRRGLS